MKCNPLPVTGSISEKKDNMKGKRHFKLTQRKAKLNGQEI
jgi:hypothetical protein